LIFIALPNLLRSITINELIRRGYVIFRYFLRVSILVRVDRAEVYQYESSMENLWCTNQGLTLIIQVPWNI